MKLYYPNIALSVEGKKKESKCLTNLKYLELSMQQNKIF